MEPLAGESVDKGFTVDPLREEKNACKFLANIPSNEAILNRNKRAQSSWFFFVMQFVLRLLTKDC